MLRCLGWLGRGGLRFGLGGGPLPLGRLGRGRLGGLGRLLGLGGGDPVAPLGARGGAAGRFALPAFGGV